MMNLKIFKSLVIGVVVFSPLTFFTTSCSTSTIFNIDGTNWKGREAGKFENNDYIVNDKDKTVTYTNGIKIYADNLVIPNYVNVNGESYAVLLGERCFAENNHLLHNLTFNIHTHIIPKYCFLDSTLLESVTFTSNILKIDEYAFAGCINLDKFSGSYEYISNLEEICDYAFYGCFLSMPLTFPKTLKKIGNYAFYFCGGLSQIDLSNCNSLTEIGKYCFNSCQVLESVQFPSSLIRINDYAFAACNRLVNINIPNNNMCFAIGEGAFYECSKFIGFSKNCQFFELKSHCFYHCSNFNITSYMLSHPKLDVIPDFAFCESNIDTLIIPPNIKFILRSSFYGCNRLWIIDFSSYQINTIPVITGISTFEGCSGAGIVYIPKYSNQVEWQKALTNKGLMLNKGWVILSKI